MNSPIQRFRPRVATRFSLFRSLVGGLLALCFAGWLTADEQPPSAAFTVHEWGTFTAIAGKDGRAVEWTPFSGITDLPQFVEHLGGPHLKAGLRGTIRL